MSLGDREEQKMALSGGQWISQFPTSSSIEDLTDPFRSNARRFVAALRQAHASVVISDTLRRPERAYLMHFAFAIAREALDPNAVPAMSGVDIQWLHLNAQGQPDLAASRSAAEQMVQGYGIVFKPALTSRHTEGKAIDMTITWQNDLVIANASGTTITISSSPRDGAGNADLHQVGSFYGVNKLLSDPPHWSSDGH
jgi:hypothetical protein